MNAVLIRARTAAAAIGLAATLTLASGVTGLAVAAESLGGPGDPSFIDGFWAAATCGFSLVLAKVDPQFYASALLICARVFGLD